MDAARNDFDVNTLGAMRMVTAFEPNVERSKQKKIVNVTSFVGSFAMGFQNSSAMNYAASVGLTTILSTCPSRDRGTKDSACSSPNWWQLT